MAFLPLFGLTAVTLMTVALLTINVQNKAANLFRLDMCARRISSERRNLMEHLVTTNRLMHTLQLVVYASRGVKLLPGVGMVAQLGEAAALTLLRKTADGQEILVQAAGIAEWPLRVCKSTTYSKALAGCDFAPLTRAQFTRERTLFVDVPGRIQWDGDETLLSVRCLMPGSGEISGVELIGEPDLTEKDFRHVYDQ